MSCNHFEMFKFFKNDGIDLMQIDAKSSEQSQPRFSFKYTSNFLS